MKKDNENIIEELERLEPEQEQAVQAMSVAAALSASTAEEYEELKAYLEAPYSYQFSGEESVLLANGALQYTHTDFMLPGKNGFDLVMTRKYDSYSSNTKEMTPEVKTGKGYLGYLGVTNLSFYDRYGKYQTVENLYEEDMAAWRDDAGNFMTEGAAKDKADEQIEKYERLYNKGTEDIELVLHRIFENGFTKVVYKKARIVRDGIYKSGAISYKDVDFLITSSRDNDHLVKTYGLGYGWSFNLPSIECVSEKNAKSFIIYKKFLHLSDGRALEMKGDGFKDYKLNDIKIQASSGEKSHPMNTSIKAKYNYIVSYKDGRKDYFEIIKDGSKIDYYKLTAQEDRFGNMIHYNMARGDGMTVTDSWGRSIKLVKSGGTMTWTLPDGKTIVYQINNNTLAKVTDQQNRDTKYTYEKKTSECQYFDHRYMNDYVNIDYHHLTQIEHPSGLKTEYTYGSNPVEIKFDNKYGGYRKYFTLAQRKDIADGKTYNVQNYTFKEAETEYIETATVTRSGTITETHSFNKENQCTAINVKHESTLAEEYSFAYGTDKDGVNYKLPIKEIHKIYGKNSKWVLKETAYQYTDDKLCNLKQEKTTWIGSNNAQLYTQIINMEYGAHSVLKKKEYFKEGTTKIIEENDVDTSGRITEHRVKDGGAVKERKKFGYKNNNVETEQCFYGDGLTSSISTTYAYGNYSPLPTAKTITGIKNADGTVAFEKGIWEEKTAYDSHGRVKEFTDANGYTTKYAYDGLGRVTKETYPDGKEKSTNYDDGVNAVTTTDENGNRQMVKYTPLGQVKEVYALDPQTKLKDFTYNSLGQVESETTYNGSGTVQAKTTYIYDLQGRVLTKKTTGNNLNVQDSYTYDNAYNSEGCRTVHTCKGDSRAADIVTIVQQDVMGNTRSETVGGKETKYEYDKLGNCKKCIAPGSVKTEWDYDYAGRVVKETNNKGDSATTQYDALGRKRFLTDFKGKVTEYKYDDLSRLILQISPFENGQSAKTRCTYDPNGNITLQEQLCNKPGAPEQWRKRSYKYDSRGRVVDAITYEEDGSINRTYYEYDGAGNVLRQYVGAGATGTGGTWATAYAYDRFGNQTRMTSPDGLSETYTYDNAGIQTGKTDRMGNTTTYSRDGMGRITSEVVKDKVGKADVTISRSYTATGQLSSESNGAVSIQYQYDNRSLLVQQTETGDIRKAYTYHDSGNRSAFRLYKGNTEVLHMQYVYDELDRLREVKRGSTVITIYDYDKNGNRKTLTYPVSGMVVSYNYNDAGLLTDLYNTKGGAHRSSYHYSYYPDGNQSRKTARLSGKADKVTSYAYDRMGRLTEEKEQGGSTIAYAYDRFGNRQKMTVTRQDGKKAVTGYEYDLRNRLETETKEDGGTKEIFHYQYDHNGNQTYREWEKFSPARTKQERKKSPGRVGFLAGKFLEDIAVIETREYNGYNQLTAVRRNGVETKYQYRPDGLRHSKAYADGSSHTHIWDGQEVVAEYGANGNVYARYLRGAGLIAREQDSQLEYYLHNAHGDVVERTSQNGTALKNYDYDAFGVEENPEKLDVNPFRYCGEYFDSETGTVYLRARYYSPGLGRFTAEDSARDGLNWYAYCNNNPARYIDKSGLAPTPQEAALMADDIYKATTDDYAKNIGGGWTLIAIERSVMGESWSNLKIGVYQREKSDGTIEYALVNKGTTPSSGDDWLNNVGGPAGLSSDMHESIGYAKLYDEKYKDQELTMVGHSKGGAEAIANAVATGRDAMTFNPMNPNLGAYGLDGSKYTGSMTHYVVQGDALNNLFGTPSVGRTTYLPQQFKTPWFLKLSIFGGPKDPIKNHAMSAVKSALKEGGYN